MNLYKNLVLIILVLNFVFSESSSGDVESKKIEWDQKLSQMKPLEPSDISDWSSVHFKDSKDSVELKNKYFSVSYPKCFKAIPEGGGDDVKTSAAILLEKPPECILKDKLGPPVKFVSIMYDFANEIKKVENAYTGDKILLKQAIKIDGNSGILFAGVTGSKNSLQARWSAYFLCSKKSFRLTVLLEPGQDTFDFLEKGNFDLPEEFKKIVATFKCAKK